MSLPTMICTNSENMFYAWIEITWVIMLHVHVRMFLKFLCWMFLTVLPFLLSFLFQRYKNFKINILICCLFFRKSLIVYIMLKYIRMILWIKTCFIRSCILRDFLLAVMYCSTTIRRHYLNLSHFPYFCIFSDLFYKSISSIVEYLGIDYEFKFLRRS